MAPIKALLKDKLMQHALQISITINESSHRTVVLQKYYATTKAALSPKGFNINNAGHSPAIMQ